MVLDRRTFVAASAALVTAPLFPQWAKADAANFKQYKLGDVTLTAITDGVAERDVAQGFVRDVPLEEVRAALTKAGLPTDKLRIGFTALVVETGGKKILIDTGNGTMGAPGTGNLLANMKAAGHEPASINTVIISHFHPDHINGLRGETLLNFENAEVTVPEAEFAFWMDDGRMAQAPEGMKGLFTMIRRVFEPDAKMIGRYKDGQELAPGLTAVSAPGHTPGHMAFALASGSERMMILSDTANLPALFVSNPDWAIQFDMDPEMARQTRRKMLDMAATEKMIVAGYHFDFPARGRVMKDGNGFAYEPVA